MKDDYILAVPSEEPGGMASGRSAHFGHCPCFTLVHLRDGEVVAVDVLDNPPHRAGGCLAPVGALRRAGVDAIVVGGMGRKPLAAMRDAGITVLQAAVGECPAVGDAVAMARDGRVAEMSPGMACSGHDCH